MAWNIGKERVGVPSGCKHLKTRALSPTPLRRSHIQEQSPGLLLRPGLWGGGRGWPGVSEGGLPWNAPSPASGSCPTGSKSAAQERGGGGSCGDTWRHLEQRSERGQCRAAGRGQAGGELERGWLQTSRPRLGLAGQAAPADKSATGRALSPAGKPLRSPPGTGFVVMKEGAGKLDSDKLLSTYCALATFLGAGCVLEKKTGLCS